MRTRSGKWVFILKTFVLFLILYWPRLLNLLTGDDTGLARTKVPIDINPFMSHSAVGISPVSFARL